MSKRLIHIGLNAVRMFIVPGTLFILSYIILNRYDNELWGAFVGELLLVNLVAHFLQWGSKDFLVRSFSNAPKDIATIFYNNFYSRLLLSIPVIGGFIFYGGIEKGGAMVLWVLGLFCYQSIESVVIYSKKYTAQILLEVFALVLMVAWMLLAKDIQVEQLIWLFAIVSLMKAFVGCFVYFPKSYKGSLDLTTYATLFPFVLIGFSGLLQSRVDQYIIALLSDKSTLAIYQIFLSAFILVQSLSGIITIPFNKHMYRVKLEVFNRFQFKIAMLGVIIVTVLGGVLTWVLQELYSIEVRSVYYLVGVLFAFPSFVYVPVIFLLYRSGKEKEVVWVNYLGAAFNLVFTVVFVYFGSAFDAIIASCVAQWLMMTWYVYRKKKIVNEIEVS